MRLRLCCARTLCAAAPWLLVSPAFGTYGACCDDATNTCTRELPEVCEAIGGRFGGPDSFCNQLDPPCGCTPSDCDDGIACTIDECEPLGDVCQHTPTDALCDDAVFCNGAESCDGELGCLLGWPPNCAHLDSSCGVGACDPAADACIALPTNEGQDCDDGRFCTVGESCVKGACVGAEPPHCSAGDPTCDDCNFNTIPDVCDLQDGTSVDVDPLDGRPDECSIPEPVSGSNWTDNIWNLDERDPDQPYPDNVDGVPGQHVTIDGVDVFLDDTVAVESLRIINDGALDVTQTGIGDLTINPNGTGGVLCEGKLRVGNDRRISAPASLMTIGSGGSYEPDPTADGDGCEPGIGVCTRLDVGAIDVRSGDVTGGRLILDDAMIVHSRGDIVVDGTDAVSLCGADAALTVAGGRAPPTLRFRGTSSVTTVGTESIAAVGADHGSLVLRGTVDFLNTSQNGIVLSGDFDNGSWAPECFNSARGGFTFRGDSPQFVEVAGRDVGPALAGFHLDGHTNFSLDRLEVAARSDVTFVNDRVNIAGGNPCNEALYVRHLTIRSEATVTLDNARVFYQSIDLAGSATVTTVGCGELLQTVCQQAPALRTGAATVDMHRYVSFAAPDTGGTTAVRVTLMDAVGFESFDGQHRWVGPPHDHPDEDTGDPGRTFRAARLQCEPFYTNWDALGTVFVFGAEVVPGSRYALQSVDESCDALLQTDEVYGGSMARTTAKWGDIVEPYDDPNGPAQPDFLDISSIVDKFQAKPGAPSKVRVQLQPNVPNPSAAISFLDIAAAVDAFSGLPYPYAGPTACP